MDVSFIVEFSIQLLSEICYFPENNAHCQIDTLPMNMLSLKLQTELRENLKFILINLISLFYNFKADIKDNL
jgi:hypothetical protein